MQSHSTLVVHSYDFDGMLSDENYLALTKSLIEIAAAEKRALNETDFAELAKKMVAVHEGFFKKEFQRLDARHVVMVGSNRQSRIKEQECQT